ncbi:hypothetical protein Gotur_035359 [Gossypium turneri]
MKEQWDFQGNMSASLAKFTANLKGSKKTTYGHITYCKRNLVHTLSAVQKQMDISGSNCLVPVEIKVWLLEEIITHIMGIPPPHPAEGLDKLRGIVVDSSCSICGHDSEDILHIIQDYILHIIRDCTLAKEVWKQELLPRDQTFLNTDGAVQLMSGRAVIGGVVRNELWGILDGLKLIQRRGHSKVVIHSGSLKVVKVIHGNVSKISNSALIRRIHRILSQES